MSTPVELAAHGAHFIKKRNWEEGHIYVERYLGPDNTWAYIHPTSNPDPHPLPVILNMLEGDDWEETTPANHHPSRL